MQIDFVWLDYECRRVGEVEELIQSRPSEFRTSDKRPQYLCSPSRPREKQASPASLPVVPHNYHLTSSAASTGLVRSRSGACRSDECDKIANHAELDVKNDKSVNNQPQKQKKTVRKPKKLRRNYVPQEPSSSSHTLLWYRST